MDRDGVCVNKIPNVTRFDGIGFVGKFNVPLKEHLQWSRVFFNTQYINVEAIILSKQSK
jgi:hypothetical protein